MPTLLLATDARTDAATLTHLAATPGHRRTERTAILTHPNLPPGTNLNHLRPRDAAELHAAITHPHTTPARRAAILNATRTRFPDSPLWRHIATYTELTTDEIRTAATTHPHATLTAHHHRALAANPHTPTDLATHAIHALANQPAIPPSDLMVIITAAERHHYDLRQLTPTTPALNAAITAYLTDRDTHATTYAQHLTNTLPPHPATWADAITATSDPHLTTTALNQHPNTAATHAARDNPRLPRHIQDIAHLSRLQPPHATGEALSNAARRALTTHPTTTHTTVELTIPLSHTHPHAARANAVLRRAALNPTTQPHTLTLIANTYLAPTPLDDAIIAAHPNTPPTLRTTTLNRAYTATTPNHTHTALTATATHLTAGSPRPAQDIPAQALNPRTEQLNAITHHIQTTTHTHPHWPLTPEGNTTLLALAPRFTGTLDQLITTAHTITT